MEETNCSDGRPAPASVVEENQPPVLGSQFNLSSEEFACLPMAETVELPPAYNVEYADRLQADANWDASKPPQQQWKSEDTFARQWSAAQSPSVQQRNAKPVQAYSLFSQTRRSPSIVRPLNPASSASSSTEDGAIGALPMRDDSPRREGPSLLGEEVNPIDDDLSSGNETQELLDDDEDDDISESLHHSDRAEVPRNKHGSSDAPSPMRQVFESSKSSVELSPSAKLLAPRRDLQRSRSATYYHYQKRWEEAERIIRTKGIETGGLQPAASSSKAVISAESSTFTLSSTSSVNLSVGQGPDCTSEERLPEANSTSPRSGAGADLVVHTSDDVEELGNRSLSSPADEGSEHDAMSSSPKPVLLSSANRRKLQSKIDDGKDTVYRPLRTHTKPSTAGIVCKLSDPHPSRVRSDATVVMAELANEYDKQHEDSKVSNGLRRSRSLSPRAATTNNVVARELSTPPQFSANVVKKSNSPLRLRRGTTSNSTESPKRNRRQSKILSLSGSTGVSKDKDRKDKSKFKKHQKTKKDIAVINGLKMRESKLYLGDVLDEDDCDSTRHERPSKEISLLSSQVYEAGVISCERPELIVTLDREVVRKARHIIRHAVATGVPHFNNRMPEKCWDIYLIASADLLKLLIDTEMGHMFSTAVCISSKQDAASACWTIRLAFDAFLSVHSSRRNEHRYKQTIDIHRAAGNGYLEQAKVLACVSEFLFSWKGPTMALHAAADRGHHEVVQVLCKSGAPVNEMTKDRGLTPLHLAAAAGALKSCRILLAQGADIDAQAPGRGGATALLLAAERAHHRVVRMLLRRNADTNLTETQMEAIGNGGELLFEECLPVTALDVALLKRDIILRNNLLIEKDALFARYHSDVKEYSVEEAMLPHFPRCVLQLNCLESLNLRGNLLSSIPDEIARLQSLTDLNLSCNKLEQFPPGVLELAKLKRLILDSNQIEHVPLEITSLTKLEVFSITKNALQSLPCELAQCPELRRLVVEHNPLVTVPNEVVARGTPRLLEYLAQMKGSKTDWRKIKLMVVGEEAVGKTSLLRAMIGKRKNLKGQAQTAVKIAKRKTSKTHFRKGGKSSDSNLTSGSPVSTDGIDISQWSFEDVTFSTWDFAGQQVFYPTHQFFLTSRSVYIIVYNCINMDTTRIQYWLRQIKAITNDRPPIFLVGTHIDDKLVHSLIKGCTEAHLNQVRQNIQSNFNRNQWNIQGYMFVSCKKDREKGIKKLMFALRDCALKSKMLTQQVPQSYVLLEKLVERHKGQQTASWAEYKKWAMDCSIKEDEVLPATLFLHDVGSLVYYDDSSSGLDQLVILQPHWLADVMSSLITHKHQWVKDGKLKRSDLPIVWKEYKPEMHGRLLALLSKFRMAHDLPNADYFIVPSLLPEDRPPDLLVAWPLQPLAGQLQFGRIYRFCFNFDFGRMIVAVLHVTTLNAVHYWRHGILVHDPTNGQQALVQWNPSTLTITIQMRVMESAFRERLEIGLLRQIIEMIENILEGFYPGRSRVERLVPCTHCIASGEIHTVGAYMFSINDLIQAVTERKAFVYCRGVPSRPVDIRFLAPDITFDDCPIIEDLEIEKKIGEGGFGVVYKGKLQSNTVAVKELIISTENSDKDEQLQKFNEFQKEVYIMSWLDHPNLVKLFGICLHPLRMVMEFCSGGDLYGLIRNAQLNPEVLSWELRLRIALDIAKGMNYLQSITPPIIHRDLRSPNIFLMAQDVDAAVVAKVADFGLSREVEVEIGGMLPTWRWLAPEVISASSKSYNELADIYSYGMICWELATLNVPFEEYDQDQRELEIKSKICENDLRPTFNAARDCPFQFRRMIEKCWLKQPEKRPSFKEIISTLSDLMGIEDTANVDDAPGRERFKGVITEDSETASRRSNDFQSSTQSGCDGDGSDGRYSVVQTLSEPNLKPIRCMAVVNKQVWCAHEDGRLSIWDAKLRRAVNLMQCTTDRVNAIVVLPGQVWIASGVIQVWNAVTFNLEKTLKGSHGQCIRAMTLVASKEPTVWSADVEGTVHVWNPQTFVSVAKIKLAEPVFAMAQTTDCVWIGQYRTMSLIHISTFATVGSCEVNRISSLLYQSGYLWGSSNDNKITVWNAKTGELVHKLEGHTGKVVCLTAVGDTVWSGSFDKTILVWNAKDFKCSQELKGNHGDTINCIVSVAPSTLWSASHDLKICVWSKHSRKRE